MFLPRKFLINPFISRVFFISILRNGISFNLQWPDEDQRKTTSESDCPGWDLLPIYLDYDYRKITKAHFLWDMSIS